MPQEIERKFLIKGEFKPLVAKSLQIIQGYLSTIPERTVRVRIYGEKAYLTIKGKASNSGLSRYEWEKEIHKSEAMELLKLCEASIIEKIRYEIPIENHIYEIDEFLGENKGLFLAEIELKTENEHFIRPKWLGEEVTGKPEYYNAMLAKHPFSKWK